MAKSKAAESRAASLNPDDFLAGGLKDDFRGRITEAVYCRCDYDGAENELGEPISVLAARMTIQPLDDEGNPNDEPYVQHWSAGNLDHFVPSQDGVEPCDEDEAGPFAVRVGKKSELNNNTNFAHLLTSIIDSGEASKKFRRSDLTNSLACVEGLDAHWDRVPQKKRSGLVRADEGERKGGRDVLVVTEVFGYGDEAASSAKGSKKAAPAAGKKVVKAEDNGSPEGDLDDRLQEAILEAITNTKDNTLRKGKVATAVLKAFAADKAKGKAVARCTQEDFLSSEDRPWSYDEDTGTLSLE